MGCSFSLHRFGGLQRGDDFGAWMERHGIEDLYKEAKALGFGEYRFRAS